jgi:hypothetical protein
MLLMLLVRLCGVREALVRHYCWRNMCGGLWVRDMAFRLVRREGWVLRGGIGGTVLRVLTKLSFDGMSDEAQIVQAGLNESIYSHSSISDSELHLDSDHQTWLLLRLHIGSNGI